MDPSPGPLTSQLLSFSAPQTSVQFHSCLVVNQAPTRLEFQEGHAHNSLHITVPKAQNTGKGKNTNSNTFGGSLPGDAVSCAGGSRGRRACSKETPLFHSRQAPEEHPKPLPLSSLYPFSRSKINNRKLRDPRSLTTFAPHLTSLLGGLLPNPCPPLPLILESGSLRPYSVCL